MNSDLQDIDAVLILGGEDKTRPRSEEALRTHRNVMAERLEPLYHIPAGYCSGLLQPSQRPSKDESHAMKMAKYLNENGIPEHMIHPEKDSLDSVANYVYARQILEELGAKKVAIVMDKIEQNRSLRTAKWVWGSDYTVVPCPVQGVDVNLKSVAIEALVNISTGLDHLLFVGLERGVRHNWFEYMQKRHPFHAHREHFSFYGLGVLGMKVLTGVPDNYKETH